MPKVPKLLIEYHGREGELFSKLERKYKLPVLKSVISTKAARLDNPEAFAGHQNIYDKLLDHRLFTGHHKHRFDDDGRGRGLDGRDYVMKGHGTFGITRYFPGADNSVDEPRRTPWPRRGYSVETGRGECRGAVIRSRPPQVRVAELRRHRVQAELSTGDAVDVRGRVLRRES